MDRALGIIMKTAVIAVALCLAASASLADETWLAFRDPGGAFTVEFSGTPTVGHSPSKTPNGLDMDTATYDVSKTDYELTIADTFGPQVQLDPGRAIDGSVEGFKGEVAQVVSDSISTLDGQVGREVVGIDKDGDTMHDRIYVVNNHVYQVMTVTPKSVTGGAVDPVLKHFAESFHFAAH
jgi:hypothetical protein